MLFLEALRTNAGVAQLVERPICNRTVMGSSPIASIPFLGVSHSGQLHRTVTPTPYRIRWFESSCPHLMPILA